MTTTTVTAIIEKIATVVTSITPTLFASRGFQRPAFGTRPLRKWMPPAGPDAMLRLFEIRRAGARDDLGIEDPRANLVAVPLTLTVAYPALPKVYSASYDDLHQVEAVVESDARQVRDAINSVSALAGAGHQSSRAFVEVLDQSDDKLWFQPFSIEAVFYIDVTP